MTIQPYVFLCHSSVDKPFVRKLDTSLSTLGIHTFLDEKDIKIGESIPRRIAAEIEKSTHLVYVLSKHSINSSWVKKELDIAHVRTMETEGYKILPLLIDETDAPLAIKPLKYGDFRSWTIPEKYYSSLRALLSSINSEPREIERQELVTYVSHLRQLMTAVGAIATAFKLVDFGLDIVAVTIDDTPLPPSYVMKICFQRVNDIDLLESVRVVEAVICGLNSKEGTETNDALNEAAFIREFLEEKDRHSSFAFKYPEDIPEYFGFKSSLSHLLTFLLRVTNEAQQTLLATVPNAGE